jgi:hypothetical protein
MAVIRVLLIFACIWLLFILAWRQLRSMVQGNAGTSASKGGSRNSKRRNARPPAADAAAHSSIIPDDVGNYVDYTEVKS